MSTPELVAGRFEIGVLAGVGGMGEVYRARDRELDRDVAVKLLRRATPLAMERFAREAEILAKLADPGIVRYVAHGATERGGAYLVMEWIEGESLAARLEREPLALGESIALGIAINSALSAAHTHGIVHRDLKPSNVILRGGDPLAPVVVDFGVARAAAEVRLTVAGGVLGTPGYMAPEQARGVSDVDARADVFSLGAVLFRCLTGRDAFTGSDPLAILMKLVLTEAPDVRDFAPNVPEPLALLVTRMLASDRNARPPDAPAVARELASLREEAPVVRVSRPPLFRKERRTLCIVVGRSRHTSADVLATIDDGTTELRQPPDEIDAIARRHGGELTRLATGAFLAVFGRGDVAKASASDLAVRAARAALAMDAALPGLLLAVVTVRDESADGQPLSVVLDRGAEILTRAKSRGVPLDAVTARLLEGRFEIASIGGEMLLVGETSGDPAGARAALGPIFGRDWEIASIVALYATVVREQSPRAAVVTAEAGAGKSRLLAEVLARLEVAEVRPVVWSLRGDPVDPSAFGLLARALRRFAGVHDADPSERARERLWTAFGGVLGDQAKAVLDVLEELLEVGIADDAAAPRVRALRRDPVALGDQARGALLTLFAKQAERAPLVLSVDDAQWADATSLAVLAAAARKLTASRLFVLVSGWPDVVERATELGDAGVTHRVRLGELSARAATALVGHVLGAAATPERVAKIVASGAGNAFFLEELARSEPGDDHVPETVLAMAEARLATLSPAARRVLRAGSIFGVTFWEAAVERLVGRAVDGIPVSTILDELVERGILVARESSRFAGERELDIRLALVRDAAYAQIADADRAPGHVLAGKWLEIVGERRPRVLAEHALRGGDRWRALAFLRRAATDAARTSDFDAVLDLVAKAFACASELASSGDAQTVDAGDTALPLELGVLHGLRTNALVWRGRPKEAAENAARALDLLAPGTVPWFRACADAAGVASRLGDEAAIERVGRELVAHSKRDPLGPWERISLARAAMHAAVLESRDILRALLSRLEGAERAFPSNDPLVLAQMHQARAFAAFAEGDLSTAYEEYSLAAVAFDRAGSLRNACNSRGNAGYSLVRLGCASDALPELVSALDAAEALGVAPLAMGISLHIGLAELRTGALVAARARLVQTAAGLDESNPHLAGAAHVYLSELHLAEGDAVGAIAEAEIAMRVLPVGTARHALSAAWCARSMLAAGRAAEALVVARTASEEMAPLDGAESHEPSIRLVHALVARAVGEHDEAVRSLGIAYDALRRDAAKIQNDARRQRFVCDVPDNALIVALSRDWDLGRTVPESD